MSHLSIHQPFFFPINVLYLFQFTHPGLPLISSHFLYASNGSYGGLNDTHRQGLSYLTQVVLIMLTVFFFP